MGFAVAAPMVLGAVAGGMLDKNNPLRGAMLGAVGGSALGPAMSGLTSVGGAASEAALAGGLGEAVGGNAAQLAAASELAGIPMGAQQAAMLAEQTAGFGNAGLASTLSSGGANPMMARLGAMAAGGPQGGSMIQGLMNGNMSTGDMLKMGGRVVGQMANANQPMPQPMAPPAAPPPREPGSMPQPAQRFITGTPSFRKRPEIWG